jgi:hypothetical protein
MHGPSTTTVTGPVVTGSATSPCSLITRVRLGSFFSLTTGTEDYFNAAWGFPSGAYAGPYHGITLAASIQEHFGTWSLYRFHIEDPVRFTRSLRFTIEHGHANDQGNDYSSVAYWYQTQPSDSVADLPQVETRLPRRWPEHGLWDE